MNYLIKLARSAVESYINNGTIISPDTGCPEEYLNKRSGVFVTIEKDRKLRGCIGTYLPTTENIAHEVIQNSIAAATEDYRFGIIRTEELAGLSFIIYILDKPLLIKKLTELNPREYGIIVRTVPINPKSKKDPVINGHYLPKCGLLLPGLDGIDTIEKQISIVCLKAGINQIEEKIFIYRFSAEKISENT